VSNGMLWPMGQASTNMAQFATLESTGYKAVKSVFPKCKVIIHLANGYDTAVYRWLFDGLKAGGASWDVVGMSMYPTDATWQNQDSLCLVNMQDMVTRYGSQVMICEAGYAVSEPTVAFNFLSDLIAKTKSVSGGIGVMYWEPEAYNGWQGYQLGAFNQLGRPTQALDAFLTP
jgi:arabinogalactan endo-1,4-beta-galactosidase